MPGSEFRLITPDNGVVGLDLDSSGRPLTPAVLLRSDDPRWHDPAAAATLRRVLPVRILVAEHAPAPASLVASADVVVSRPGLAEGAVESDDPMSAARELAELVGRYSTAALTLAWLLRAEVYRAVDAGLAAESSAYSALLGSEQFRAWRAARPPTRPSDGPERVRFTLDGTLLRLTLARAGRRNAVDTHMRSALVEVLQIALLDDSVRVEIDADGPSFSAGGDLDEFGSATDLGLAHLVRVGGGAGQVLHDLAGRVTVRVHGACIGAGIELPAFAGHVVAAADSVFQLPEVSMGLIPGAGGTVSIPRRIGRGRTFWLAVSGQRVNATTALSWGLIDALA